MTTSNHSRAFGSNLAVALALPPALYVELQWVMPTMLPGNRVPQAFEWAFVWICVGAGFVFLVRACERR